MKIIYDYEQGVGNNVVLTFGNFDGVHLGHELAISTLKKIAQERGLPSAILTFEPHPSTILFGRNNFRLINQERKKELISRYGIDYLYIINFNEGFSQISCNDFISKVLIGRYSAKHIVIGESCTFGHKRLGNTSTLREHSETYGYSLTELEPLIIDGEVCSSSSIREYLQKGETEIANKLFGRPYQVSGIVTKGACRGREIGFPTINIPIEDCMIKPKFGTYYAKAAFSDNNSNWLYGVVNIGMRPTFKDLKKPIVEMHIFDFNKNVYDYKVNIQLLKFIRSEKRFHNVDELTKQINYDILEAYQLRTNL
ncbi:riboflavin biosynthesis protein RibF [Wolbachia pipientis]|uniref:riboflavin biosynthesis protein RibF n=1 Tax=Wolbachia pipientis TaxID=955 RepID=UPI002030283D|nr:riboflavin biosynthesis protein RibF [Wolbachia pipientis]MCM1001944.1 riboflavin biosynthesis protein RibF [Wolbachia pipientis]